MSRAAPPQAVIDRAVTDGDLPYAVAMVADRDGIVWAGTAGEVAPDAVFGIFSMSKAVGAVAAMILVERGALNLETPVADILPAFADMKVLDGWDGEAPRLRPPARQATLHQLLTHSAGLEYPHWNRPIRDFVARTGHPIAPSGKRQGLMCPMATDPGIRFGYGAGIDWAGEMVAAVSGQPVDTFLKEALFEPLGMGDTDVEVRAHMAGRLPPVMRRSGTGFERTEAAPPAGPEFYGMGHCLYSTAPDYLRFLRMLLNGGSLDGVRILSAASVETMLADHLAPLRFRPMITANPSLSADFDPFPGLDAGHSLGFLRVAEDVPGRRRAGSQSWAGILNTHCWLDPESGLTALLMTQTLPFVEPRFMATWEAFEHAVYAMRG